MVLKKKLDNLISNYSFVMEVFEMDSQLKILNI